MMFVHCPLASFWPDTLTSRSPLSSLFFLSSSSRDFSLLTPLLIITRLPMVPSSRFPSPRSLLFTLVVAAANAVFSVGLLGRSRSFFLELGFPLPALVTMLQLWCLAFVLLVAGLTGVVSLRRLPLVYILPLAFCFGGVCLLQNASLVHNSLLFHCLLRPLTTVVFSAVSSMILDANHHQPAPRGRRLTALAVCAGAVMAMAADPERSWFGVLVGVSYVIGSALYETLLVAVQIELGCDVVQLLACMAPPAAVCLTFLCHIIDDLGTQPIWPRGAAAWQLSVMCAYAALIPVTAQLLTGRLSLLGFHVFGLVKLSVMLWEGSRQPRTAAADWHAHCGTVACVIALVRYTAPVTSFSQPSPLASATNRRRLDSRTNTDEITDTTLKPRYVDVEGSELKE